MEMATLGSSGSGEGKSGKFEGVGGAVPRSYGGEAVLGRRASYACWESSKNSTQRGFPRRSSLATVLPSEELRGGARNNGAERAFVLTFALPSAGTGDERKVPYSEQVTRIGAALLNAPGRLMDGGTLLHTSERGVMFPVIHLTDHPDAVRRVQQRLFKENVDIPLGDEFVLHQGLYREVRKVHIDKEPSAFSEIPPLNSSTKGYILIGFKSLDRSFDQLMVETWKEWTGVRSLELYLPASLGLSCIRFFLRQGAEAHLFMYVVLAECSTGAVTPEHHLRLLDFAQRMRVERMNGYISVYRPVRLFPPVPPPQPPIAVWEDICPSYNLPNSYNSPNRSNGSHKGQIHSLSGVSSVPPKVEI